MEELKYLKSKEVKSIFKISDQTLRRWRVAGKIQYKQISRNKFLYPEKDVTRLLGESNTNSSDTRKPAIYCRVSSTSQRDDLKRQKKLILDYCNSQGFIVEDNYVFQEIASGMNENRQEFWKLVHLILEHKISHVFVTYKDRLTRFGFSYFEKLFLEFDCQIVTLNNMGDEDDFEKEMTEDLISIIHHFSMKMYSKRRKKLKKFEKDLLKEDDSDE